MKGGRVSSAFKAEHVQVSLLRRHSCRYSSNSNMTSQDSPSPANVRRSQRVAARIHVSVVRSEAGREIISEDTHTLVVNAHGALLPLAMMVRSGDALILKHLMSREEKPIRVVRVIEEEPIALPKVAVAFTGPAPHFWHIDFPPADWQLLQD
jgi:hypothetical protein